MIDSASLRVLAKVVDPLSEWFGREVPKGQAKVYIEILGFYDAETLESAMRQVKESWVQNRMPQPGVFKEICEKLHREKKDFEPAKSTPAQKISFDFFYYAGEILPTTIGRLALRESWANSLVNDYMAGKRDFAQDDVEQYRLAKRKAAEAANSLQPDSSPTDKALLNLYHSMQHGEQKLLDKFKHLILERSNAA